MGDPEQINADQLAFWNGPGGHTWVARQEHTDITLAHVTEALLAFARPQAGERVLDIGCGCGATTLEFARAVGTSGRVAALDISGPMLAEGQARANAAGIANIAWRQVDPATAALDAYDLLTSAFGVMFFGDPVGAFANMRGAASPGVLASASRKPMDGSADECGLSPSAAAAESGPERARNVRLRRSSARDRSSHHSRVGDTAAREARPRSGHRRWPRAGRGCGSVD